MFISLVFLTLNTQPAFRFDRVSHNNDIINLNKFRKVIDQIVVINTRLKTPNDIENAI
jgi:hypothetical protein